MSENLFFNSCFAESLLKDSFAEDMIFYDMFCFLIEFLWHYSTSSTLSYWWWVSFSLIVIPLLVICIFSLAVLKNFLFVFVGFYYNVLGVHFLFLFVCVLVDMFSSCIIWCFVSSGKFIAITFSDLFLLYYLLPLLRTSWHLYSNKTIISVLLLASFSDSTFYFFTFFFYILILYFISDEFVIVYVVKHSWWFVSMCV